MLVLPLPLQAILFSYYFVIENFAINSINYLLNFSYALTFQRNNQ